MIGYGANPPAADWPGGAHGDEARSLAANRNVDPGLGQGGGQLLGGLELLEPDFRVLMDRASKRDGLGNDIGVDRHEAP